MRIVVVLAVVALMAGCGKKAPEPPAEGTGTIEVTDSAATDVDTLNFVPPGPPPGKGKH